MCWVIAAIKSQGVKTSKLRPIFLFMPERDRLDATESVDGGGLHCVLFRLRHDFSPEDVLGSTA
jgi:hypothetical protein